MDILGISCYYHDADAALIRDGEVIAAAEEERFTRKKHDYGFPKNAINFCLKKGNIPKEGLDYVVFYEKPFIKFERILLNVFQTFPKSSILFREAMLAWLLDKLWIKNLISSYLNIKSDKILFCEHHLSHAASAFLCSPFEEAAILTADGVGEWATTTMGIGKGTDIKIFREIRYPHSLGLLYSAFTAFLGFEVNDGEYKVMGMAPYGAPKYVDEVYKLIKTGSDGSFWLDLKYFSYHYSVTKTFNKKFIKLFGEPRARDAHFFTLNTGYPIYFGNKPDNFVELAKINQHYADVAASIQKMTEEILIKMVNYLYNETKLKKLCFAGGVALNSVANGRILRETPFEEIFVQPAAGDSGGAIGAALYAYYKLTGKHRKFVMEHAYLGEEYSNDEIKDFLEKNSVSYKYIPNEEELIDAIVNSLIEGKVIGWFQGRFEWGPRALGNRSILADPSKHNIKDIVNLKIKFREPFRPFAPSVLVEKTDEYFDLDNPQKHYPARFMLLVVNVKKPKQREIPAVTHVDGSGRLQTVFKDTNPLYYRLVEKFGEKTGIPVVLNTSFNLKGEPIVNTPENGFNTFRKSDMDILVLGNYFIKK